MSEPRIITTEFTAMPKGLFDPMPKVIATFDDGRVEELFEFYPDEISFNHAEFIFDLFKSSAREADTSSFS